MMTGRNWLRMRQGAQGLVLACAALPAMAGAAQPAAVANDVGAAWADFIGGADAEAVHSAYRVADAVGYTGTDVDPVACAERVGDIRAAVAAVPVGFALHRVALLCAEATGDGVAADAAADALEALSRLALSQAGAPGLATPIPVVRPEDVYAFLLTLGLEPLDAHFHELRPVRYFPLEVAAREADTDRQRRFVFDFVDVGYRIERSSDHAGFPQARVDIADAWVKALAQHDNIAALDLQALEVARLAGTPADKIAALRDAAAAGGVQSARAWILMCLQAQDTSCEGLVDALLPAAEAGWSLAMAHLAVAHAEGLGVEPDQAMADALLARAVVVAPPGDAQVEYFALRGSSPKRDVATLAGGLRPLATDAHAGAMVALMDLDLEGTHWPAGMLAKLENAPLSGLRPVARRLGYHYRRAGDEAAADTWRDRAAALGDAESQVERAMAMVVDGLPPERQVDEVNALLREAAQGGDIVGARWSAWHASRGGRKRDAELWLLPAIGAGSPDAIMDLAELVLDDDGTETRVQPALMIDALREIAAEGNARARQAIAGFALERGHEGFTLREAEALLREDAERGDGDAMLMLGSAYLRGRFGPRDAEAGRQWLQRALDAGVHGAYGNYGSSLYYGGASASERMEGIELLRKGEAEGEETAANNLAWTLCTSRHADVLDPPRGAEAAQVLAARLEHPDAGVLDTFAACHAAVGEHQQAVAMQERAIAGLPLRADGTPDDRSGFAERLALYRAGLAYVELEDK